MNAPSSSLNIPAPASRSTLVTVIAWIAIALGILTACLAFSQFQWFGNMADVPVTHANPAGQDGLVRWFQGITLVNVAIGGFLAYLGYALWKRRNWARRTFIVLFALGIVANAIGIAVGALAGSVFGQLGTGFGALFIVPALLGLGAVVLFVWLIRRLRSAAVKSEFV